LSLELIRTSIASAAFSRQLSDWAARSEGRPAGRGLSAGRSVSLRGAVGSLPAFLVAQTFLDTGRPVLCLLPDEDAAAFFGSDLQQILGSDEQVLLLPLSDNRPFDPEHMPDPAPTMARGDVLEQLKDGFRGILVCSVPAFAERVPPAETLRSATLDLEAGMEMDPEELIERLVGQGFSRTEFVETPGDLALRGGILDIFPYTGSYPIRIEFFGDEIDSIREFDIHTQRSISRRTSARLVPNLEGRAAEHGERVPLITHLPDDALVVQLDGAALLEAADALREQREAQRRAALEKAASSGPKRRATTDDDDDPDEAAIRPDRMLPEVADLYLDGVGMQAELLGFDTVHVGSFQELAEETIQVDSHPQPGFASRIALLRKRLLDNERQGLKTQILCDNRGQEGRLAELLEEDLEARRVQLKTESLHRGFEVPEIGLALYTDHEIFGRYHRPTARKARRKVGGLSLRELHQLTPGDFVVHIDYGIGKFAGMEQIEVRGRKQEAIRLLYLSGDTLYVNVNALYKLHKYKGKEGHQPQLTKLGSGQWEKAKARTKSRVKDIARDLIALYAKRKASDGHAYPADTVWQQELEASFQFEDTPDQATTAAAVKQDMQLPQPMDRLVCGDVGFGKTEIAIRAAFKAAQDGKQVAVLVPTTVLASQHFRSFSKRLANYPVQIGVLSRFRSAAQQAETLKALSEGRLDIVIGTQRLMSKDVEFKDLGLLIVDEEQRFGVGMKEKLRTLRVNVDTLTLTATPIPRTLQFSLMGARDLSIIATAPENRQPIQTEIHAFDKDLIRDAILYEISRGGQVFFIHNRVQSIDEIAAMLRMLIPDIRVRTAHGQMNGTDLERIMMGFVEGEFDVLVSTNIIENGLDIANANTIIINRADHFGLAELHQLRGRVGRSNRKAFCFLLVPSVHSLTREAKQRLQAVEEFSDLGSGFHLAMRDLDIRGAGNMLGAEQSGFIADVGFETYHRILDEAVDELRTEEFSGVFEEKRTPRASETVIDVDADALIPDTYLSNRIERLNVYRRISEADSPESLAQIAEELADRFGPLPDEVSQLILSMELKILGQSLRLPKVTFKNERLFLGFPATEEDPWFYGHRFQPLLRALADLGHRYVLKDSQSGKLRAILQDVPDLSTCRSLMTRLIGLLPAA
jgi:transcription-repair coupling factor (superfamily II helicase)